MSTDADIVENCRMMLADVPGEDLESKLTTFIGYYMAFQIAVPQLHAERDAAARDAARYRWLRERDLDTINQGGVFAGRTSKSGSGGMVINLEDLDRTVDTALFATNQTGGAK